MIVFDLFCHLLWQLIIMSFSHTEFVKDLVDQIFPDLLAYDLSQGGISAHQINGDQVLRHAAFKRTGGVFKAPGGILKPVPVPDIGDHDLIIEDHIALIEDQSPVPSAADISMIL